MAGFVVVVLLLTLGMTLALQRIGHVTTRQLAHVRSEEYEITLVERLRWSGEVFVSVGRAYLISGEPTQLADLSLAKRDFDTAAAALGKTELSPVGATRVEEVRRAAHAFMAVQEELVQQRSTSDVSAIVKRFETELLPARVVLRRALDELVGHKTAVIERVYMDAKQERARLMTWMYALLATLAIGSLGVSWLAARRLTSTYRRESEALETARRALAARDELMGIIAHDLRSPLGAITMRAELLESTTIDPKAREQAAAINNTATRMADLIKTMLDVTVIEAGQFTVHTAPCDVDRLLQQELDMHSMIASSKQIRLERRISEPGLVVMADQARIFQVISNLIGNAVKFTPKGGRIEIAAERVGEAVAFAVSDTGPGIPQQTCRGSWKDESRGTKGTGLGLFIVKSIIDAHGGSISVESPPGQGATFRFTLPSATPDVVLESRSRLSA
jgi:signal transduction histidine kinase